MESSDQQIVSYYFLFMLFESTPHSLLFDIEQKSIIIVIINYMPSIPMGCFPLFTFKCESLATATGKNDQWFVVQECKNSWKWHHKSQTIFSLTSISHSHNGAGEKAMREGYSTGINACIIILHFITAT